MTPTPETIAAYADGELEGEALREVEAALAADPGLIAQVEAHRALRARLSAHFAPLAELPVPEDLLRTARGGAEIIDLVAAARKRASRGPLPFGGRLRWVGPALAASLVLAVVGYGVSTGPPAGYAAGSLAVALDRQLVATQSPGAPVHILLSFRDEAGDFCRGYSSAAQAGIACRDARGWKLGKTFGGAEDQRGEFRQAGSAAAEALAAIQDMAQGPALDADGERDARGRGWRP